MIITQWNVLANTLCTPDSFNKVNPTYLTWEYRSQLIKQILPHSDVYCLQEVDEPAYFKSIFPEQYEVVFHKKPDNQDGTLVAFNKNLNLKSYEVKQFTLDGVKQNQSFLKFIFEKFTLITTHLKAKPQFEAVRKQQLIEIAAEVTDRTIVTGDFNTQPELEAVTNFLGITKMISVNNDLPTTSKNRGKLETNIKDYILYSQELKLLNLTMPSPNLLNENGLPSEQFPSDHFYLTAVFDIDMNK